MKNQFIYEGAFTMGKASRSYVLNKSQLSTPSPGTYNFNQVLYKNSPKYSFRSSNLQTQIKTSITPGPGHYIKQKQVKQPTQQKQTNNNIIKIKRPQQDFRSYSLKSFLEQNHSSFNFGYRYDDSSLLNHYPGPGEYEIRLQKYQKGSTKGSFGFAQRNSNTNSDNIPGPCQYNPIYNTKYTYNPIIGKQERILQKNPNINTPGPGKYQTAKYQGKKITISPIRNQYNKQQLNIPGPGKYNMPQKKVNTMVKMTKQKKKNKITSLEPFGHDIPRFPLLNGFSGGTIRQNYCNQKLSDNFISPGPGQYNINNGNTSLAYSMGIKPSQKISEQYQTNSKIQPNYKSIQKHSSSAHITKAFTNNPLKQDNRNYSPFSNIFSKNQQGISFPKQKRNYQVKKSQGSQFAGDFKTIGLYPSYIQKQMIKKVK